MSSFERSVALAALVALLAAALLASPAAVGAQAQVSTPTFLAIPDQYPVDGPVAVVRESGRNIVLMRESEATPEALNVALVLLRRLTEREPLRPGLAHMAPVTGYYVRTPVDATRKAELEEVLSRLRERPVTRLGNLGFGRFMLLQEAGGRPGA